MARYIDADKLEEALRVDYDREGEKADTYAANGDVDLAVKYSHGQFCYHNAMERVKDAPTADVAPKFEIERGDNGIDHCPLCGSYSITAEGMDRLRMAHKEPGQHGDPVGEQGYSAIDVAKLEATMKGFIEIRHKFGNRLLLNIKHIEEVRENTCDDTCCIYLAFNVPNAEEQDYYEVKQSYDEIVALIKEAVE